MQILVATNGRFRLGIQSKLYEYLVFGVPTQRDSLPGPGDGSCYILFVYTHIIQLGSYLIDTIDIQGNQHNTIGLFPYIKICSRKQLAGCFGDSNLILDILTN